MYSKENDGALQDPDIRDVFLDDLTCQFCDRSTRKTNISFDRIDVFLSVLDYNETTVSTVTQQFKAQQLLSIILMGIVGTRYGQEIETNKQGNVPIKGFTVENPEMILKLSSLVFLILAESSNEGKRRKVNFDFSFHRFQVAF